jgi:hypothetical protein
VQQQPPLQVSPSGSQRVDVLAERLGVALDPLEYSGWENDLLVRDGRQALDLNADASER